MIKNLQDPIERLMDVKVLLWGVYKLELRQNVSRGIFVFLVII